MYSMRKKRKHSFNNMGYAIYETVIRHFCEDINRDFDRPLGKSGEKVHQMHVEKLKKKYCRGK